MGLVASALSLGVAFAIIAGLLAVYMRRVADIALTDQFRAAETIVNGRIPEQWVAQINRRIARRGIMRLFLRDVTGIELALAKIDKLYRFYENSPFFEDAKARELLLSQLQETRKRWGAQVTWEELVADSDGGPRPNFEGG